VNELTFEDFDPADLASWLERSRSNYISERMAAGDTLAEATANADASLARTFAGGSPAPGQMVGWVSDDGVRVGELWIGPYGDNPYRWWVWDVAIEETRRGQGLGRKTMILAEKLASANGATSIGLNVFARNAVARGLYRSLGYEETSVQMRKSLLPAHKAPSTAADS
jgi:ribosomal protein S18 acetylase RimI-like enzyme